MTRPKPGANLRRLQRLATEPATPTQVGAAIAEFERLGIHDRSERLALSAALLSLDELTSTTDLTMGQAGKLVGILRATRAPSELPDLAGQDDDNHDTPRPAPIAELLNSLVRAIASAIKPTR